MYGDDHQRESWSGDSSSPEADRKSVGNIIPRVSLTRPRRTSYVRPASTLRTTELSYDDSETVGSNQRGAGSLTVKPVVTMNGTAYGLNATTAHSRATSYVPPPLSMRSSTIDSEERRASTGQLSTPSFRATRSREAIQNPSTYSRSSNSLQAGHNDLRNDNTYSKGLPPFPHSHTLPRIPSTSFSSLPQLPPSQSSSSQPSPAATPPRQPSPTIQTPVTPASLPLKHGPFSGTPSSKISLVPSEGEDLDAFHVRSTYAQLEVSGVKGDGYEEGVERTRARIGTSRTSQLNALNALGDGTEKTRDLEAREIETLASVDR